MEEVFNVDFDGDTDTELFIPQVAEVENKKKRKRMVLDELPEVECRVCGGLCRAKFINSKHMIVKTGCYQD